MQEAEEGSRDRCGNNVRGRATRTGRFMFSFIAGVVGLPTRQTGARSTRVSQAAVQRAATCFRISKSAIDR